MKLAAMNLGHLTCYSFFSYCSKKKKTYFFILSNNLLSSGWEAHLYNTQPLPILCKNVVGVDGSSHMVRPKRNLLTVSSTFIDIGSLGHEVVPFCKSFSVKLMRLSVLRFFVCVRMCERGLSDTWLERFRYIFLLRI